MDSEKQEAIFTVDFDDSEICSKLVGLTQDLFDEVEYITTAYVEDLEAGWRATAQTVRVPYSVGKEDELYRLWENIISALKLVDAYLKQAGAPAPIEIPLRYRMFWRKKPYIAKVIHAHADYSDPTHEYYVLARIAFAPLYGEGK